MRPMTLIWLTVGSKLEGRVKVSRRRCGVYEARRNARQTKSFPRNWDASFCATRTMGEVCLDLVAVIDELLKHD